MKKPKIITLAFIQRMTGDDELTLKQARRLGREKGYTVVKDYKEARELEQRT